MQERNDNIELKDEESSLFILILFSFDQLWKQRDKVNVPEEKFTVELRLPTTPVKRIREQVRSAGCMACLQPLRQSISCGVIL